MPLVPMGLSEKVTIAQVCADVAASEGSVSASKFDQPLGLVVAARGERFGADMTDAQTTAELGEGCE